MVLTLGEHIGIDRVAPISSTTLERNSVKDYRGEKISGANFFSVLMDGPGKDTIEVVTAFLRLVHMHSRNTLYIYKS